MSDNEGVNYGGGLNPDEEIRYLHSRLVLKLTWMDVFKILIGGRPIMAFCVRLRIFKNSDGSFQDIDTDMHGAKIIVASKDDVLETKEAIFDYDHMHN